MSRESSKTFHGGLDNDTPLHTIGIIYVHYARM